MSAAKAFDTTESYSIQQCQIKPCSCHLLKQKELSTQKHVSQNVFSETNLRSFLKFKYPESHIPICGLKVFTFCICHPIFQFWNFACGHHLQDQYSECGCGPIHRWDYGACCYAKIRDHTVKTDGPEEILSFLSIFIVKAVGMFDYFNGFLDDVSATS
jgi:hypothetical protein